MSSFVSLEDVKKIYQMGEVQIMAAAGIDFQIERGEFAVVVGPSGAGKTTVLNILGGMDTASSGRVIVDGKDIAQYSQKLDKLNKEYRKVDELEVKQMSLFDTVSDNDIVADIKNLDIGHMTPIDALNTLYKLQEKINNRW